MQQYLTPCVKFVIKKFISGYNYLKQIKIQLLKKKPQNWIFILFIMTKKCWDKYFHHFLTSKGEKTLHCQSDVTLLRIYKFSILKYCAIIKRKCSCFGDIEERIVDF